MTFKDVIDSYQNKTTPPQDRKEATIKVSAATSVVAFLYEKIRVAVEFKEDHLLRKLAIGRILNRRIKLGTNRNNLALYLLKELVRAKYLANDTIPESKVTDITNILNKYFYILDNYSTVFKFSKWDLTDWLISIASVEIDESLAPATQRNSLALYMAKLLAKETELPEFDLYLATQKGLNKSDNAILRYLVFIQTFNFWDKNPSEENLKLVASQIEETVKTINLKVDETLDSRSLKLVKGQIAPFVILREIMAKDPSFLETYQDERLLEQKVRNMCALKYAQVGDRLKRMVIRSVIYVFLTKMVFGILIEVPLDRLTLGHINWRAASINLVFPPFLMYLVGSRTRVPGEKNTNLIVTRARNVVIDNELKLSKNELRVGIPKKRNLLRAFFRLFYLFTFFVSFGAITYLLLKIGFTFVSVGVFLFFLSVISFFAFIIRQSTKDIVLTHEEDSVLGSVFDLFFLPILRVGQRLSQEIARLNLFVFFFDFIIEAPLTTIIEITEEWFAYVREKKEEVV
ncbi:hypothetical protein L6255_01555 [Candidatus Parcubacteria bacterium]|nr:hypothetical protein [Patescibacteria group bacterium]MBU4380800.1 hypothetical protein [Patescibacteria group bacterium]MCG2689104.1 hypothetical protein [Candidatus Parcubacteria bacterium]